MDLSKIFLKGACPTPIGGQAVLDGVMMRGTDRMAVAVRIPDGRIHIKTMPVEKLGKWAKIPIIRGVVSFVTSLVFGMKTLLYSADVAEAYGFGDEENTSEEAEEPSRFEKWLVDKFGEKGAWNIAIWFSVILAIVIAVAIFVVMPTVVVNLFGKIIKSSFLLNLIEGIFRIALFIGYIALIRRMDDIKTLFRYHGAEHKTIHCFENNLELTPENAQQFYTLHPRCGTSFIVYVMVISLLVFSLVGWPSLGMRVLSRVVLIPLVAGISYEVLKLAGRSSNKLVEILAVPGLYMQKLTTAEPTNEMLEVAIASLKAVLVEGDAPYIEGICDKDANLIEPHAVEQK